MRRDASKPYYFIFWLDFALDAFPNMLGVMLDKFCTFKYQGFI